MLPIHENCAGSKFAPDGVSCGAVGMLLSVMAIVEPSRGAEFAMKPAALRLLAPTMLLTTTFGLPGKCSP